jgi:hypothetical protein
MHSDTYEHFVHTLTIVAVPHLAVSMCGRNTISPFLCMIINSFN